MSPQEKLLDEVKRREELFTKLMEVFYPGTVNIGVLKSYSSHELERLAMSILDLRSCRAMLEKYEQRNDQLLSEAVNG